MFKQGEHLSGKPGHVRDFGSCQGNIRDFTKSLGSVREKILSGKSGQKLFIVSCVVASVWVFSNILLVLEYEYHLTWTGVLRIVTEMSGDFTVIIIIIKFFNKS